jgi:hypothetical protein
LGASVKLEAIASRWRLPSTMNTPQHWFIKKDEYTGNIFLFFAREEGPLRDAPLQEIQIVKYKVSDYLLIVFAKNDLSGYVLDPEHQHANHPLLFSEIMDYIVNALERHT